jgi:hypothetical protein
MLEGKIIMKTPADDSDEQVYRTEVYPKVSGLSRKRNKQQQQQTLVEKQRKGLWRQNSLN